MEAELAEFLDYIRDIKLASNNTVMAYERDLTKFFSSLKKQNIYSLERINETSINSFIISIEKEGLSAATVSRNIASIKSFILCMIKKGKITKDPTERIKSPKVFKKPPMILSIENINLLLAMPNTNVYKGIRDKAMLELLYTTGIGISDLINLKVQDLNLKSNYIICSSTCKEQVIPLNKRCKESLILYIKETNKKQIVEEQQSFLFVNNVGKPMSRQGFWKMVKCYSQLANIEEITLQILRNSFVAHF